MDGGKADAEGGPREQHAVVSHAQGSGKKLGLPRKREAEGLQALLGNRAGDHRVGRTVGEALSGLVEGVEGGLGGARVRLARGACAAIAEDFKLEASGQAA